MTEAEILLKQRILLDIAAIKVLNEPYDIEGVSPVPFGNETLINGVRKIAEIFGTTVQCGENYHGERYIATKIDGIIFIEYEEGAKHV